MRKLLVVVTTLIATPAFAAPTLTVDVG